MKRTIWIVLGGVALIAVLAGAAFLGMRLLNAGTPGGNGLSIGGPLMGKGGGMGGPDKMAIRIDLERAPELPEQQADFSGQVTDMRDNSIFVAPMDKSGVFISRGGQGAGQSLSAMPTPSGPSTEVVITKETRIYRDISFENIPKPSANSGAQEVKVQQKVEPAALADVSTDSSVQIWGQKRGERLVADFILIFGPVMIKK